MAAQRLYQMRARSRTDAQGANETTIGALAAAAGEEIGHHLPSEALGQAPDLGGPHAALPRPSPGSVGTSSASTAQTPAATWRAASDAAGSRRI